MNDGQLDPSDRDRRNPVQEPSGGQPQDQGSAAERDGGQDGAGPRGGRGGAGSRGGQDGAGPCGGQDGAGPRGGKEGVGRRGFLAGVGLTGAGGLIGASMAATPSAAAGPSPDTAAGGTPHAAPATASRAGDADKLRPDRLTGRRMLLVPELLLLADGPARGQAVLVESGKFRDIGPAERLIAAHHDLHPVRLDGHLLMPGFIDAHHHLTQSFGKAKSFGQPSEIFKTIWEPLEHALDEESAYLSAKLAALEALRGGFTTVADAGTRAPVDVAALAKGTDEAGIRCVLSKIVSDGKGGPAHLARWGGHPLIHPSLAIAVPEDATAAVIKKTADLCAEAGVVLQIHVNEHLASVERSLKSVGRRPIDYLHHIGALGPHLLGAHATLTTPTEMRQLADSGAAVSYNPVASAWKGNAVAQATMMAATGVRFGTGTDGTRGDGFRLVDAAESAQRLTSGLATGDSSCGAGRLWLDHATRLSADAVGLGHVTGEIAVGKAADFLVVDVNVPELTPSSDLRWELVRLSNRDQITAVVVDGRLRLWEGWPPDWDGRALVARAAEVGPRVVRRAKLQRVEPT
ncbi:amidohydrolase family protein [Streptomyces sp. NPDC059398]|uniref:amidohydrolase family protein n=1 Tax=Streptomyces sp. NPDC059398 TaxID=3346820 RepID=UPI0036A1D10A